MIPFLLPGAIAMFVIVGSMLFMIVAGYQFVRPGTAIVIQRRKGEPVVLLEGGGFAWPGFAKARVVDTSEHQLDIGTGADGFRIRFAARPSSGDVLALAAAVGPEAGEPEAIDRWARPLLERIVAEVVAQGTSADERGERIQERASKALTGCEVRAVERAS